MAPPTRRRDPYSRLVVKVPERSLATAIRDLAAPLLEALGPTPDESEVQRTFDLTVTVWNALVRAGPYWQRPGELNALRRKARARDGDPALRRALAEIEPLFRAHPEFDPRVVRSWFFVKNTSGAPEFVCDPELPPRAEVWTPPPAEKRVAIGGRYLDEVRVRITATSYRAFTVADHSGAVAPDGVATIRTPLATALGLFAEGALRPVGGDPVTVRVGTRDLGHMVLRDVLLVDVMTGSPGAALVFAPIVAGSTAPSPSKVAPANT